VRWLPLYSLSNQGAYQAPSPESAASEVEPLYPELKILAASEHPFHVPYVNRRDSMLIEPAIYLNALMRDFQIAGGRIIIREFHAREEFVNLREGLIFNCTGLGARTLFNDDELMPIKGQLVFLLPQPEVNYMTVGPSGIYMFPRHDGILLGGSQERGNFDLTPDPSTTERILRDNGALFGGMKS
jgi:glycine/D-amino acid oxidase-like deaminating enzyme